MYDLIIIGGGPGGYMAAQRAGHAGLRVLLIEKRALGGVCLNEGCIPSKTLLHSAKLLDYTKHGAQYGVSFGMYQPEIDHKSVISRKNEVVDKLVSGVKALMKANKVNVIYGQAHIIDNTHVGVGEEVYTGSRLLIATGSVPVVPQIDGVADGLESGLVLTSREILDLDKVPEHLVIIGGGVVGLEMASYYNAAGSKVTVIEMLPKIGAAVDAEISVLLMKSLQDKGIEFLLGTKVTSITKDFVNYSNDSHVSGKIKANKVLLSIGRKPLIDGFGLENLGLVIENGAVKTDSHGLTSLPNIYAVGDVNGRYMLAHTAYREAEVAVNHILGKRDVMRYDAVPSVIYTSPEVACVGETIESAESRGLDPADIAEVTVPMVYSGRYVAENIATDGICKIIVDKKHQSIIGVHLYGSYASEIIPSACIMIEMQMRIEDAQKIIFPHPTVGEILREAVFKI
ncbi:MAG: dihydrolipoyl dehydrogenase [Oscillospiraceae bacterium]|jgi:dihydrolipoamide dehydrogenase|nr:dihydrolipoyl dehydrogenase [Oscillospiraceae bacterium]